MKINSSSSIQLHNRLHGKLSVISKVRLNKRRLLSLAYTPGVADVVGLISREKDQVYNLTIKGNTVAVITDGSAVLGLGNVGPIAAIPVMEGKCALFKEFAGIDSFPICIDSQNVTDIVNTIKNIAPIFGAINLEDISAPRCFEIESKLQKTLTIPVMHDDQHATAIVALAGLINALKVTGKNSKMSKVVVVGSGAAGSAIAKLLSVFGIRDLLVVDRKGILSRQRKDLAGYKKELVRITNPRNISGLLTDAVNKADVVIGVASKNLFTKEIIRSMNPLSIVFALANPDPEVTQTDAKQWGVAVYASGRSDYPNQINNALVFPGFFKGLLKSKKNVITDKLKIACALALSQLIDHPTKKCIIPSLFDTRVVSTISKTVENFD